MSKRFFLAIGLAALIAFRDELRKNRGEMIVVNIPPNIAHLFETLGFNDFFIVRPDEQQAIEEFHTVRG